MTDLVFWVALICSKSLCLGAGYAGGDKYLEICVPYEITQKENFVPSIYVADESRTIRIEQVTCGDPA